MFEPTWSRRTVEQDPGAPFFNDTAKYVVSSTLTGPRGRTRRSSARMTQADPDAEGRGAKGLYVSGSGTLVRALIADGLVDELHLFVYPVTRGSGPRLFAEDALPATWERASADLYDNGVTYLKLTPAS